MLKAMDGRALVIPVICRYCDADDYDQLDVKRANRLACWGRRRQVTRSEVIRALIDNAGPVDTGDDLIEWIDCAAGKGLGLTQRSLKAPGAPR